MDNKNKIFLLIVFLLALILRLCAYPWGRTFSSGDEAAFVLYSIYFTKLPHASSLAAWLKDFYKIASVTWGYGYQLVIFINILTLRLFQVNLNEFTLACPYIILGAVDCVLIYLFVKEIYNEKAALIAALFLCVSPWHIKFSCTAGNHAVPVFLLLASLYFFVLACKNNFTIRWQFILASFFTGLYFVSDGQFPAFVILMFFIVYIISADKKPMNILNQIFTRKVLFFPVLFMLPVVIVQIYLVFYGKPTYGYLGHYFEKNSRLGFYLLDLLQNLKLNCGMGLLVLFILGLLYNYKKLIKLELCSIVYFWLFFYVWPWIFLIPKEATMISGYLFSVQMSLIVLASVFVADVFDLIRGFKFAFFAALTAVVLLTLFSYNFGGDPFLKNCGNKSAGYLIRQYVHGKESVKIFTDMEPPLARYYFSDIDIFAKNEIDLTKPETAVDYFNLVKRKADIIAVTSSTYKVLAKDIQKIGFNDRVFIFNGGRCVFAVLKKGRGHLAHFDTAELDPKFDKEYGSIKSLFSEKISGEAFYSYKIIMRER